MSLQPKNDLPAGTRLTVWIVYSSCAVGTFIEASFTNKDQADASLRWHIENDRNNNNYWIREIQTQPHEA